MSLKYLTVFIFCSIILFVSDIKGYKILGVFPVFAPSHYFLGNELMKGLAEAGHDVTMMSVIKEKNPPKNGKYKQIIMENLIEDQIALFGQMLNLSSNFVKNIYSNPFAKFYQFRSIGNHITENTLKNEEMQKLIKSKEQFDILIVPQFYIEGVKALAPHLGAHLVLFNNNALTSWMGHFVGYPSLPSIDSEIFMGYSGQMNFEQRLKNTLIKIAMYIITNLFNYPDQNKLVHKYISKEIDLTEVQYNVSLVLSNSHISLNNAQSSVPVIKDIGGFHVRPPKNLPEELQKYLDEAKYGVIYFSLGSNLKGVDLPPEIKKALMQAFSKRKENILWKFENDEMPGKPDNVRIEKWLPQNDILAHPNVKLFLTHFGFLSTIEIVYHGVPTVGIPIMGDQLRNAKTAEDEGLTLVLEFKSLTEERISSAIEEVLTNKKYLENIKYRSRIFHDRPTKPLDDAVYWIEYVVKHNGAKHLRVDYLNLTWYQYFLLDVFAFIFTVIFLVLLIVRKTICIISRLFKSKTSKKLKTKKH